MTHYFGFTGNTQHPNTNMNPKDLLTPSITHAVNAYLMAKAYAETMRPRVDAVHREILTERPIFADLDEGQRILDSGDLYLCSNRELCAEFYAEANRRLRGLGIKPDSMPDNHCPALVAESLLSQAENALADLSGEPFGLSAHRLLCAGLENYHKWVNLVCKLVINSEGYQAPTFA